MTVHSFGNAAGFDDGDANSPVVNTPAQKAGDTVYGDLRAALTQPVDVPKSITLAVRGRKGIAVQYGTDLGLDQLNIYRKRARKNPKKADSEIDILRLNQLIVAGQCQGVVLNGQLQTDAEGTPLTFTHAELKSMLNVIDHFAAISALYPTDADVLNVGTKILDAAGYTEDEDDDDEDVEDEGPLG